MERVTTDPSLSDTDNDGMDDGWEFHFGRELVEMFFDESGDLQVEDVEVLSEEERVVNGYFIPDSSYVLNYYHLSRIAFLDPLDPSDASMDIDVQSVIHFENGSRYVLIYRPDGLSNLEEYRFNTSPLLWDTDEDSFFNVLTGEFYDMSDIVEI